MTEKYEKKQTPLQLNTVISFQKWPRAGTLQFKLHICDNVVVIWELSESAFNTKTHSKIKWEYAKAVVDVHFFQNNIVLAEQLWVIKISFSLCVVSPVGGVFRARVMNMYNHKDVLKVRANVFGGERESAGFLQNNRDDVVPNVPLPQ